MRKKLEKQLKTVQIAQIGEEFPELSASKLEQLQELLEGRSVGVNICHVWLEEGQRILYNGNIEKMKAKVKYVCIGHKPRYTATQQIMTCLLLSWRLT